MGGMVLLSVLSLQMYDIIFIFQRSRPRFVKQCAVVSPRRVNAEIISRLVATLLATPSTLLHCVGNSRIVTRRVGENGPIRFFPST